MANSVRIGHFSMVAYVLLTALSAIFIHQTNQQTEPILAAFYTFLFCLIVYTSVTANNGFNIKLLQRHFSTVVMLNVTTMLCWVLSFVALKYIPPDLYLFVYLCAMPISGALFFRRKHLKTCSLLGGIALLASTYAVPHLLLGFILAFTGGACGTIYSIYCKKIADVFSVMSILSLRFYLTVLVTGLICIYSNQLHWMDLTYYAQFGSLSLTAVVIPLLLFQVGLKSLPLTRTLAFLPLAPLCCYLISHFILHSEAVNTMQLVAVVLLSSAMLL